MKFPGLRGAAGAVFLCIAACAPNAHAAHASDVADGVGGLVFEEDADAGPQLWISDGVTATLLKTFAPSIENYPPQQFEMFQGLIYFNADDSANDATPAGPVLWTYDPASHDPAGISAFSPTVYTPVEFTNLDDNLLYFIARDAKDAAGYGLWSFDGATAQSLTADGTVTPSGFSPVLMNDTLFFVADLGDGPAIWSTQTADGSDLTEITCPALACATPALLPVELTVVGSTLYFVAADADNEFEIWKTDGTPAGTQEVTGTADLAPKNLASVNGRLFFSAKTTGSDPVCTAAHDQGREPWVTNAGGTSAAPLANIFPCVSGTDLGSDPTPVADLGTQLIFLADDGTTGSEPWITDGTTATQLKDIRTGSGDSGISSGAVLPGNVLVFNATTKDAGNELWRTDGTGAGTVLLDNLRSGDSSSKPSRFTVSGSKAFFHASGGGDQLWITDGMVGGGTTRIQTFDVVHNSGGGGGGGGGGGALDGATLALLGALLAARRRAARR